MASETLPPALGLSAATTAALDEALSTMAFISPLPADDDAPPSGPAVLTRIEFRGAATGSMELVCSTRLGAVLAENLLGEPVEGGPECRASADALRELVNVACGALLRGSGVTARGVVEMGVPTQRPFDVADWPDFAAGVATLLDADGQKLAVRVTGLG